MDISLLPKLKYMLTPIYSLGFTSFESLFCLVLFNFIFHEGTFYLRKII